MPELPSLTDEEVDAITTRTPWEGFQYKLHFRPLVRAAFAAGVAAERERATKDAERYRWLKDHGAAVFDKQQSWRLPNGDKIYSRHPAAMELDAAIDDARTND